MKKLFILYWYDKNKNESRITENIVKGDLEEYEIKFVRAYESPK